MKPVKKVVKKSTTKKFKPDFVVDMTGINDEVSLYIEILTKKLENNITLTSDEIKNLVIYSALEFVENLFGDNCVLLAKTNSGYRRVNVYKVENKPTLWQRIKNFFKRK